MPAFEVFVNGVRASLAGVEPDGFLNVMLTYRGPCSRGADDPLQLSLSGRDGRTVGHATWAVPSVNVGDEITIRVSDVSAADPPTRRVILDAADLLADNQRYVREMAAEWGWEIRESS